MEKYIIKNARLVNEEIIDIYVCNGFIQQIAPHLEYNKDIKVIEFDQDSYVSPGWIDIHTHCFDKFEMYGDRIDLVGYPQGVCTVIDAGTAGSDTIDELYQQAQKAKTRVYSLLNISRTGICAQDELSDLTLLDKVSLLAACQKYPNFIIGLKARMSKTVLGNSGNKPLMFAKEMQKIVHLPIMTHIGTAPSLLEDVVHILDKDDIITHIFNPKDNGILKDGQIKECVHQAIKKGILLDLGHGTDSFSFEVAKVAFDNDIMVDTISSDIYFRNRKNGPVFNLVTTMNKLLYIGYSLEKVIHCVTDDAAKAICLKNLGKLEVGMIADFTIFKLEDSAIELVDSTGKKVVAHRHIVPTHTIVKNHIYDIEGENKWMFMKNMG